MCDVVFACKYYSIDSDRVREGDSGRADRQTERQRERQQTRMLPAYAELAQEANGSNANALL